MGKKFLGGDELIILEDVNFVWEKEEISQAIEMWDSGVYVPNMAKALNRPTEEVFLLLMHLSMEDKIKQRKGYFWGNGDER